MTRPKNFDTVFNRYRKIANPYKQDLEQGKRLYGQLEEFTITSLDDWETYKSLETKYNEVRERCNTRAKELVSLQEKLESKA